MRVVNISKHSKPFSLECDSIAPDKSISHRCAIFSLLSDRVSTIRNFLLGEDTLASLSIAEQLGATVLRDGANITITPPIKVSEPDNILDCGNAGIVIRD